MNQYVELDSLPKYHVQSQLDHRYRIVHQIEFRPSIKSSPSIVMDDAERIHQFSDKPNY